jgi:two-component system, cell cycle response regulator DivK
MGFSETVPIRARERRRGVGKTVLIVEDNELNMKLFHDLLEAHGYQILQTRDGMEALQIARDHKPDLILMDIQMPVMDGYEATRRIKANPELKAIPILAVTSYALSGDEDKARAAGCDGYIAKPYSPRQMLAKVREILG